MLASESRDDLVMNPVLMNMYKTGLTEDAAGQQVAAFPSGVILDTGTILYRLVRDHHYHNTLEIGLACGLSALFICQAHQERGLGIHTAIDPFETSRYRSTGLLNVQRAGLDNRLRFFPAPSCEVLPRLVAANERFDLAFVDGRHHLDYALVDFFYIDKLLKVGGVIVFDDLWLPAIRQVISFILRNRSFALKRLQSDLRRPFWRRIASTVLRILHNPMNENYRVAMIPQNVAVLEKMSEDTRDWRMHRSIRV